MMAARRPSSSAICAKAGWISYGFISSKSQKDGHGFAASLRVMGAESELEPGGVSTHEPNGSLGAGVGPSAAADAQEEPPRAAAIEAFEKLGAQYTRGDDVLIKPANPGEPYYVARIEEIYHGDDGIMINVSWYYRPEEVKGGRKCFHGKKELLLSDHRDSCSATSVDGRARVSDVDTFVALEAVDEGDFFCRFRYSSKTGAFDPDMVDVYCRCMMPYNPDEMMIGCNACQEWFHPECVRMGPAEVEAAQSQPWSCPDCEARGAVPAPDPEVPTSSTAPAPKPKSVKSKSKPPAKGRRWSAEEGRLLEALVRKYGRDQWRKVLRAGGVVFDGRTVTELRERWRSIAKRKKHDGRVEDEAGEEAKVPPRDLAAQPAVHAVPKDGAHGHVATLNLQL